MPNVRATVVHISDLHFGGNINDGLVRQLKQLLNGIAPDFLAVTGDLAENPFPWSMRRAAQYLAEIADECRLTSDRVLVIPGNHDYKIKGTFGLRRLTRIPYEIYFRRNGLTIRFWQRWLAYLYLTLNALWPRGKELRGELLIRHDENHAIAFVAFNSTPLWEWFGFATGFVSDDQISQLTNEFSGKRAIQLKRAFKIVLVHHHPIPIPYVGTEAKERLEESFMVFYNAGTFLRELGYCGIDLILHGHKHFAGFTRIIYDLPAGVQSEIGILAAGSPTHRERTDPLGNGFNIIRVYDDDTASIEQWYFSTDVRHKDVSRNYWLYDLNRVRHLRNKRSSLEKGVTIERIKRNVRLTGDGYSEIQEHLEGCRVCIKDGLSSYDSDLTVARPAYLRGLKLLQNPRAPTFSSLAIDKANSHLRKVIYSISFGEVHTEADGPFDLSYAYQLMNGHALNLREFRRKYPGQGARWEYASIMCEEPCEALSLKVEFPEEVDINTLNYGAEVVYIPSPLVDGGDNYQKQHDEETRRIRGKVKPNGRSLELEVVSPIPEFVYRIRWNYERQQTVNPGTRRAQQGVLKYACGKLIEIAKETAEGNKSSPIYDCIVGRLTEFLDDVLEPYPRIDPNEKVDISLAVYDENGSVLRFVAANFAAIGELFREAFLPGEGCVGFSYEKASVLFYDSSQTQIDYYIGPAELQREPKSPSALAEHTVLVVIPWLDETGNGLGAISVGSSLEHSRLLRIFDMSPEEQAAEKDRLLSLTASFTSIIVHLLLGMEQGGEQDASENKNTLSRDD